MSDWKQILGRVAVRAERHFDKLKYGLDKRLGTYRDVQIVPYMGFGNGSSLYLKGRVLKNHRPAAPRDRDSAWHNLLDAYRRFETDELPGVEVELQWNHTLHITATDDEGFFTFDLQDIPAAPPAQAGFMHQAPLRLVTQLASKPVTATAQILIPPANARFGVISDIDDTVLVSDATHLLRMTKLAFLHSFRTRLPFEGVAAFYQALQQGTASDVFNPVFYVSSSPWNLYGLLTDFFALQGVPAGPLMLKDLGISEMHGLGTPHLAHKLSQINRIMQMYPQLPFIFLGDSGQRDPEIYAHAARDYPGRVLAAYIRDVSGDQRDAAVRAIIADLAATGVEMLLVPDTETAARHAVAQGWVAHQAPEAVKHAEENLPAPDGDWQQIVGQ